MIHRILICCNFYPPFFIGGAEIIAHEQACRLLKAGYQVAVFCGKHDDGARRYSIIQEQLDGLQVFRVILHTADYNLGQNFYNHAVDNLFDGVLEKIKPDVVHFHNIISLSLGIIERAYRRQIKTLLTLHDHWGFCYKNTRLKAHDLVCTDFSQCAECLPELTDSRGRRFHIRMRNDYIAWQLNKVDNFVSPSSYLASAYVKAGISSNHISVISNGIDVERFQRINKKPSNVPLSFTFIGHLDFHKGVHVLIAAMNMLLQNGYLGSVCKINIVGNGAMASDLAKFVEENKISSAVNLLGKVNHSQIESVYDCTDVLIMPSVWPENEPVTILEAMAAGIPVLASNRGGNLDLIEDGITGYLFDSGDARKLAEKITQIALHSDQLEFIGQKAHAKVVNNTLENYSQKIIKLYKETQLISKKISQKVILCCGESVLEKSFSTIAKFEESVHSSSYKFLMSDWVTLKEWEQAELLWIVDDKGNEQDILNALKLGLAILVPQQNQKLVELCRIGQCGLFYADEIEAEVCLEYFINEPLILKTLGQNAKRFSNKLSTLSSFYKIKL
ncbi:glycosyl transferase group 1 [Calothrix sp. HK-06]|nr:glycosyl transferase group 1 [Calothrix sp. HK-06]